MTWPNYSPNLNPSENLWNIMILMVTNFQQKLQEEWGKITPEQYGKLVIWI